MNKKHKKFCMVLNYIESLLLIVAAKFSMCFNLCFCFISCYSCGVASSTKVCVITTGVEKYKKI